MKSKLYPDIWGVRHQSFFMDTKGRPKNMRPLVPIIPVRPTHGTNIWINEQHDTDRDGVPNYRDCQPHNPNKHGFFKKAVSVAKKVGKELATVPEVHIDDTQKLSLVRTRPKRRKVPGLTKSKKYILLWGKVFIIYNETGGPSYMEILDFAPAGKTQKIFDYITLQLNKKGEISFSEVVRKFYGQTLYAEKIMETIKWMSNNGKLKVMNDGINILSLKK